MTALYLIRDENEENRELAKVFTDINEIKPVTEEDVHRARNQHGSLFTRHLFTEQLSTKYGIVSFTTNPLHPLMSARRRTKPRSYDVFCGVLYLLKSGCQWRMLPADFPDWRTCYQYFRQWSEQPDPEQDSILEQVLKKIGWRGPTKQWEGRADQLLHRGLPERQEHGHRRAEGL